MLNFYCLEKALGIVSPPHFVCDLSRKLSVILYSINLLSANPTKWSNKLKQFVGILPTNCLSVFDHFVKLALKGLAHQILLSESHYFSRY